MAEPPAPAPSLMLLDALRATEPGAPPSLLEFARIVGGPDPSPDFIEWSARVGESYQAARLTYYFDADRRGADGIREAGARFLRLACALDVAVPGPLDAALGVAVPGRGEVLQVVVGIDERPGAGRRVKFYLVLREAAPDLVERLLEAVGERCPGDFDPGKVYILGLDLGPGGLVDAKLYARLDRGRLARVVANLREVGGLAKATREVVFQRCLRSGRSQVYLHADNPLSIGQYLARRAPGDEGARRLLAHHEAVQKKLQRGRLEPWIISFSYRDHRLVTGEGNVYFHLLGTDKGADRPGNLAGGGH